MKQAEINRRMQPWGDREIARFQFRVGMLQARGLSERRAERVADRLALRDQERDDRRACIECTAWPGRSRGACAMRQPVIHDALMRCAGFSWQTP